MGERRKLRQKLQSHHRTLQEHLDKIAQERKRYQPRQHLIELWKKHIDNIRRHIEQIERRLKS